MKKKQKAKLLSRFRPNYEQARAQLFEKLVEITKADYGYAIEVGIDPKKQDDLTITYHGTGAQPAKIAVPMDENFVTVVKRIQQQEKGLMERFSANLAKGIADYLSQMTNPSPKKPATATQMDAEATKTQNQKTGEMNQTQAIPAENQSAATTALSYKEFTQKIADFTKFFVENSADAVLVKEKTAKEDRLLATISTQEADSFTIEKALERKYKLKTEVIPVIEAFAKTPLAAR